MNICPGRNPDPVTQVNFYTLSSEDSQSRYQFACRLAEKAAALGHQVLLQTQTSEQAKILDDLMWQFKPASFLPHSIVEEQDGGEAIVISAGAYPERMTDVLINLSDQACKKPEHFKRINEILNADPDVLQAGRNSYRFYQGKGCQPETHKL